MTDENGANVEPLPDVTPVIVERNRIDRELSRRLYRHLAAGQTLDEATRAMSTDPAALDAAMRVFFLDSMIEGWDEITREGPDLERCRPFSIDGILFRTDQQLLDWLKDKPEGARCRSATLF
jgi:hypothetical protein